jgi:tetratricopeptide (TPR) repeat protein
MEDRYGLKLSTASADARDAYADGVDRMLAGDEGAEHAFQRALDLDSDFALAKAALARAQQFLGDGRAARTFMGEALEMTAPSTDREKSHLNAMDLLIKGRPEGYDAIQTHLVDHPRDALIAQTCCGVFGLIGFSGQPGRESEQLAFTTSLARHYGDDWWFLGQHAFSQVEAGQTAVADTSIDRALAGNPRSAHNAHIRAHVDYEAGGADVGLKRLTEWLPGLERAAIMHCHISWHISLWALAAGDIDRMWQVYDEGVSPEGAWGPTINVITDCVALLYRAQLAGVPVSAERWQVISDYATTTFPRTGIGFVDAHAALAFAMSGDSAELDRVLENAKGPAADVVTALAKGFRKMSARDWTGAIDDLSGTMGCHDRIGGSRAQRDLVEFAMAEAMKQAGRADEASRMLKMRRPIHQPDAVVAGL